jgi:Ran GTPase-activating protein (RanGAP) involved in mRNA processing and transport
VESTGHRRGTTDFSVSAARVPLTRHTLSGSCEQTLDLADNQLGPAGAKLVATALASLPRLKELHLSTNHMAATGARDVAAALRSLPQLEVLDVGSNLLGCAGAAMLGEALCALPKLQVL